MCWSLIADTNLQSGESKRRMHAPFIKGQFLRQTYGWGSSKRPRTHVQQLEFAGEDL